MAELMDIKAVIPNPDNPRFIRNEDYEKLLYSIQTFPSMTKLRKIIVNDKMIIQGGNMRYRASKELKKKEVYVDIYTQEMYQQDLKARRELAEKNGEEYKEESYEQLCKEFVIRDNVEFGQWNYDDLANEWEAQELEKWGTKLPNFGNIDMLDTVNSGDEYDEWVGMPEFDPKENTLKIVISFENESDREEFAKIHDLQFIKKQQNAWMSRFPWVDRQDLVALKYE